MEDYRYGSVIIEEKGRDGLSTWEAVGLVMSGAAVMALAFALALAIVQLSLALSVSIVAVGLGLGGSLFAGGVANVVLAWGKARALMLRESARVELERQRVEAMRLQVERERLRIEERNSLPRALRRTGEGKEADAFGPPLRRLKVK